MRQRRRGAKGGDIVLTEDINGSEDAVDSEDTEPEGDDSGAGVCGDGKWAGGVVDIIVHCPSGTDVVEVTVAMFWWRNNVEELN